MTISSYVTVKSAFLRSASGSSLYPFIRNSYARCTRLGVLRRPSRFGSSPRRTIISLTNSSKLALVRVGVSVVDRVAILVPQFGASRILKGIHHSFFKAHLFQMSKAESAPQNIVDRDTEIFGCGNGIGELGKNIEILQVETLNDLATDEPV